MQLTMTGEYAIRTMMHLASKPFGSVVRISDISKTWSIPVTFLRKIATQLGKSGLITSQRGRRGGLLLAQRAEEVTLLDIVEAIEGKIALNQCLLTDSFCPRTGWCAVHLVWAEAQERMKEVLAGKTLSQLAAEDQERNQAHINLRLAVSKISG